MTRTTRLPLGLAALALALPLALSGCSSPAPDFSGKNGEYYKLVWDEYSECLQKLDLSDFSFNPGGIDPRQVGTVEASSGKAEAYFAIVTGVNEGDDLALVPDAGTAQTLASVGC